MITASKKLKSEPSLTISKESLDSLQNSIEKTKYNNLVLLEKSKKQKIDKAIKLFQNETGIDFKLNANLNFSSENKKKPKIY